MQHEFVEAERKLLGRGDKELTSLTGYAGGKSTDKEGRVCYHNFQSIADYGKLGHGEVVGMKIPQSSIGDFAKEYFDLFTPKGERVDPGDRGGEYRSLIGLPGGVKNPRYAEVEAAATAKGMTLEAGKGNDPDTLGKKLVFVYDTAKFPFYQAEVYHQFHNDFQSPAYGKKYNDLVKEAVEDDRVKITRMLSLTLLFRNLRLLSLFWELEDFRKITETFKRFSRPFVTIMFSLYSVMFFYAVIGEFFYAGLITM